MRSDVIVIVSPKGQFAAGIVYRVEDLLVEQLVTQAAVKRLDEPILLRFSWINVMPVNVVIARPFQDRATGELRPVVTDNANRLAKDTH